jgi:tetratricopeptide (TPR) repeat protein
VVLRCAAELPRRLFCRPWRALAVFLLLAAIGLGAGMVGLQVWARFHYQSAERALERHQLKEAQTHLESCLQVWPSSFDVHLLAAQTARRLDDYESAERHLARCQELRGGLPEEVVLEKSLIRAQRGGMDSVMPYVRSLMEQNHPSTPLIVDAMVRGYLRAYRFIDAGTLLTLWQKLRPDDVQAYLLMGYVREQIGPEEEAVRNYERVLELQPDNGDARLRVVDLLLDRSEPAQALEHAQRLAQRRPEDPSILVRLARCFFDQGRSQEAEEMVDRVLAEDSRYRPALALKGQLALRLGRPAEAERCLREALSMDAGDHHAQFALTRSLREQGKAQEAEAAEARLMVIEADARRIRKIFREDINESPNDPKLRTEVGDILLRAGAEREGVQWLYSALRQGPTYAPAHRALADYFERIGVPERAAPHRRFLEGDEEPKSSSGS